MDLPDAAGDRAEPDELAADRMIGTTTATGRLRQAATWRVRALADLCLLLLLAAYLAVTVATFFGRVSWVADIATHFRPHLVGLAILLAPAIAVAGRRRWLAPLALAAAIHAVPLLRPVEAPTASGPGPHIRLVTFNVLSDNGAFDDVVAYLRDRQADVLVIEEASLPWRRPLERLADRLPYTTATVPGVGELDTVIMSRFPIRQITVEVPRDGAGPALALPMPRVVLDVEGTPLVVWGVHPPSPLDAWSWRSRNAYHLYVATRAAMEEPTTPVIVAGDFNQTPWTPWHREFLARSGLIDAAGTSWPAATRHPFWPLRWRPIGVPIDRVALRPGIGVRALEVGPSLGSDHHAVTADLVIGRPPAPPG